MPTYLLRCPTCRTEARPSAFSGSQFRVFACARCETRYCHHCPGSSGGRRCPDCGADEHRVVGVVAPR